MDDKTVAAGLLATLYRRDCPDTIELGDYQLGLLPETEQMQLRTHLNRCPHCQAELTRLTEFLAEEIAPVRPLPAVEELTWTQERNFKWRLGEAKQVIIQLLAEVLNQISSSLTSPPGQLAYATGRRGSDESRRIFQLSLEEADEDLEITLTAEAQRGDPAHCTVIVDVNIPSRGGWPNLANTEVTLKRNDKTLTTRATDAFGKAIFEGIAPAELPLLAFEITPH